MLIFVVTSLAMYFSNNAINTILLLILIALSISCILFTLNMDFLGFILIIIYVGAIAILFLFIVMMLQIKVQNLKTNNYLFFYIIAIFFISSYLSLEFKNVFSKESFTFFSNNFFIIDTFFNINIIGQTLFSYFSPLIILAGILLLVAMIISIVLTLNFSTFKIIPDYSYKQLSKVSFIFKKSNI